MECCFNCKHARDMFYSNESWDGLFYCDKREQIFLWNVNRHRCDYYESNLHDDNTAPDNA